MPEQIEMKTDAAAASTSAVAETKRKPEDVRLEDDASDSDCFCLIFVLS